MRAAGEIRARDHLKAARPSFDVMKIRQDFPILKTKVRGKPLVYLDNAATTQKPQAVIDALTRYYAAGNSNVHRGIHFLSQHATALYEQARRKVQRFINAAHPEEIIFVRGATEAINLVAHSYAGPRLGAGDEIVISTMEHHSNIVPWQILCEARGASLKVAPISDSGEILLPEFEKMLGPKVKLVSVVHVSNALGTINPVGKIVTMAHLKGIPVLLDGAQAVPHMPVDVRDLDCDFYVFSGHKLFGPTGVGVLYGRKATLQAMPPYQGGGDMIASVSFEKTTYKAPPHRFEAGTPHIAGVIGLGAAIDYLNGLDLEAAAAHERDLLAYATDALLAVPGLRIVGTAREKTSVLSFVFEKIHPHDIGTILDHQGIAIRAGHHCTQPLMKRFGVPATSRASLAFYNTRQEVDALAAALRKVLEVFQ